MSRKQEAQDRATLKALKAIEDVYERQSWALTLEQIWNLPEASVVPDAPRALGEMES